MTPAHLPLAHLTQPTSPLSTSPLHTSTSPSHPCLPHPAHLTPAHLTQPTSPLPTSPSPPHPAHLTSAHLTQPASPLHLCCSDCPFMLRHSPPCCPLHTTNSFCHFPLSTEATSFSNKSRVICDPTLYPITCSICPIGFNRLLFSKFGARMYLSLMDCLFSPT